MELNTNICYLFLCIICLLITDANGAVIHSKTLQTPPKWANNEEIAIFREYLRIPTVHPNIDYKPAVAFLEKQAASLDLPLKVYYQVNKENPVVVMTWQGSQPELPTILLNSHMDVVPVYEEFWTHPPFAAEMEENGDIFARGAQDMKCLGMQYLAAIRALKRQGIDRLKRTIHIIFVPDEEKGGRQGMAQFCKSNEFKAMNVAFVLDEGNVGTNGELPAYYVEKTIWDIEFIIHGQSGHGSKLLDDTPGEKFNYVIKKMMQYRAEEKRKLVELKYPEGNITSINLTQLKGGVANNVIPAELSATFDMRVSINTDLNQFEQLLSRWCEEAGGNITIKTLGRSAKQMATRADDSNPYWVAFKKGANDAGVKVVPTVLSASSDMKHIRRLNISAIGFSPMLNTEFRMHDNNEYLNADTYLAGIKIYEAIITSLGNF